MIVQSSSNVGETVSDSTLPSQTNCSEKHGRKALRVSFILGLVEFKPASIKVSGERTMARLPKFSLAYNDKRKKWELKREGSGEVIRRFKTKAAATKGGVLERSVKKLGSVRIRKRNGQIQEERTYPRSADPRGRG
jgi:hypothetical protein